MPVYPMLSIVAVVAVVAFERLVAHTGVMLTKAYWISMVIIFGFMIPVDGWLTKLSAPIVTYRVGDTSGHRPIWDIPLEEFAYAFALCTLVIVLWERSAKPDVVAGPQSADDRSSRPAEIAR